MIFMICDLAARLDKIVKKKKYPNNGERTEIILRL